MIQTTLFNKISSLPTVQKIIAGSNHTIAITQQGIYTWGKSDTNSVGIEINTNQPLIFHPIKMDNACAGNNHYFGWNKNQVYCWGSNQQYKLGLPQLKTYPLTKSQLFLQTIDAGMELLEISCGDSHSIAVFKLNQEDNRVSYQIYAWGDSKNYQLALDTEGTVNQPILIDFCQPVNKLVSCSQYNVIVTQDGECYSWGTNIFCRLGFDRFIKNQKIPTKINLDVRIITVSAGKYHCIAVSDEGVGFSWGYGLQGQLGLGEIFSEAMPSRIPLDVKIIDCACGQYHSLINTIEKGIMSSGTNNYQALGHNKIDGKKRCLKFEQIQSNFDTVSIVCGNRHNVLLTKNGQIFTWGCNKFGQLGPQQKQNEIKQLKQNSSIIEATPQKIEKYSNIKYEQGNKIFKIMQQKYDKNLINQLMQWKIKYSQFKAQTAQKQKNFMMEFDNILQKQRHQ